MKITYHKIIAHHKSTTLNILHKRKQNKVEFMRETAIYGMLCATTISDQKYLDKAFSRLANLLKEPESVVCIKCTE